MLQQCPNVPGHLLLPFGDKEISVFAQNSVVGTLNFKGSEFRPPKLFFLERSKITNKITCKINRELCSETLIQMNALLFLILNNTSVAS